MNGLSDLLGHLSPGAAYAVVAAAVLAESILLGTPPKSPPPHCAQRRGAAGCGLGSVSPACPPRAQRTELASLVVALSRYSSGPRRKKRDQIAANSVAPAMKQAGSQAELESGGVAASPGRARMTRMAHVQGQGHGAHGDDRRRQSA